MELNWDAVPVVRDSLCATGEQAMTSRPAAPESPETDALLMQHLSPRNKWLGLGRESYREAAIRQVGALIEHARSLERRLSLAQTEIKGHMRVEDELKAELMAEVDTVSALVRERKEARARIAELEKAIVGECDDCGHTIITPLHPLPSVEQDAARYRWLRDESGKHSVPASTGTMMPGAGIKVIYDFPTVRVPCTAMLDGESLDAAIDSALKSRA